MADATRMIRFPGSQGALLAARLDLPSGTASAYALFAHCFTCSKETLAAARISRALTLHGIGVLRFDFTGLGGSEGEFANTNFSSNVEDLIAAADWLRSSYGGPRLLVGHSFGGAAVLAAAHAIPESSAVATISAPADPSHIRHLLASSVADIERTGEARVVLDQRSFTIRKQFLEDLADQRLRDRIANLGKALLVLHSPRDTIVDITNASQIFTAARHPKSFVSLDTADHLLTHAYDAGYVAAVLAAWADRYIRQPTESPSSAPGRPGTVTVTAVTGSRYAQTITAGRHQLIADEPETAGGTDQGPTPYDLLVAALGACTSMTLRMYADAKKIALERVTVRLAHEKVHPEDCANCDTRSEKIDRIEREIELEGALSDADRTRLLAIADRCPVHRTLQSSVLVHTRLKA